VEAEVESLDALSAHADSEELLEWMKPAATDPKSKLKKVFLVHGEPEQSKALAEAIRIKYNVDAAPVEPGQKYNL
jgi:metallo-beta-lactamase family protein